jgi:hypothetical protein
MGRKALVAIVMVQFLVICALGLLLLQGTRPTAERERVETALADIRGALSVGANYTQFQEKVQALAAAVENFRAKGGGGTDLARFEQAQELYKDSLDLWSDELNSSWRYENGRKRVPDVLERIAKEQGVDVSSPEISYYKYFADELLQQLWAKADEAGHGVKLVPPHPKK